MKKEINWLCVCFSIVVLSAPACKKNNSFIVTPANVYIAGSTAYSATVWNNNQANYLTTDSISSATSIFVSGNDVYVGGAIFITGFGNVPVYWKNGNANFLSLPDSTNTVGIVNSIFVSGTDVYAGGSAGNMVADSTTYAVVWKDGAISILDSIPLFDSVSSIPCSVNSMYVSGSNVYAAGYGHNGACYWNNGNSTALATDLNTLANALFVSGSDIYVAGQQTDSAFSVATYWKNGTPGNLTVAANSNSICRSVFVSGSDVYVCGNQMVNGATVATYWKNGTPVIVGTASGNSDAYSIFVKGNDIYVSGKINDAACYWKNGTETLLTQPAVANSLFVQ